MAQSFISLSGVSASVPRPTVVLAISQDINPQVASLLEAQYRVVEQVSLLDEVVDAVTRHQPQIVVLSRFCPGSVEYLAVVKAVRMAAPHIRLVALFGAMTDAVRRDLVAGKEFGLYNVVVSRDDGYLDPDELLAAIGEDRSWADLARLTGESSALHAAPPVRPEPVSTPPSAPDGYLALALGHLSQDLHQTLNVDFPAQVLPTWDVQSVADTTDDLLTAAQEFGARWTTLVVSVALEAPTPLVTTLIRLRRQFPHLRIAVLMGEDGPEVRRIIGQLAAHAIWNVLVGKQVTAEQLGDLITRDWPWEKIAPYLPEEGDASPPITLQFGTPLAGASTSAPPTDPEVMAAQTIAVISGKGGVGKTGVVASLLVAAASLGAVAIDADYVKPSLGLAFRAADDPGPHDLRQLLTTLESSSADNTKAEPGEWTVQNRRDIREWVSQAEVMPGGARIIPAYARLSPVMPTIPPGLVPALTEAANRISRLTFIDTPGSTNEDAWVDAVTVADWIILVTTPDYPAILEAVEVLRKLEYLHVPRSHVRLIINRQSKKAGYSTDEICHTHLKLPSLGEIADDPAAWDRAWRTHRPIATHPRQLEFWQTMVRELTGLDPNAARKTPRPSKERRRWFRRRRALTE